ncbi:hypothetical protein B005_2390 [Nocardiopsis alba ATCC BAA-2165]|uniref:Uncharacterized protein n=1 Tax=Nocardiopsis alba (strain ATCC BAA-2165 / BE74) TaxID=1205910 RepID=J7L6Z7_NOCAA|nr:hypothetical protein B005_2390 [Nocardiopsis alba ATCC BAA-2165]
MYIFASDRPHTDDVARPSLITRDPQGTGFRAVPRRMGGPGFVTTLISRAIVPARGSGSTGTA